MLMFSKIRRDLTDFSIKLYVDVFLLAEHNGVLLIAETKCQYFRRESPEETKNIFVGEKNVKWRKKCLYLEMEVEENNHFSITGLEESILNIIVQNINFVTPNGCVTKTIGVSFETAGHSFRHDVWSDVEILEFRVALILRQDESILFHEIFFFSFLGFAIFEFFLNFLYEPERRVQIRGRS